LSATDKSLVTQLWQRGVDAVGGEASVRRALQQDSDFAADYIVAVGKAASEMCLGALRTLPNPCPALVITKYGHSAQALKDYPSVEILESAHPVPDEHSIAAGHRLLEVIQTLPSHTKLLLLVSGGASALTEALPAEVTLDELQQLTASMLSAGKTIAEINATRKKISLIKGGKLLQNFNGSEARSYIISDVEGDSIDVIASGTGASHLCPVSATSRVIAANQVARDAIEQAAIELGLSVRVNEEALYQDVMVLAGTLATQLKSGPPGVYILGGEPTIVLPETPGEGGRNQSLALALAIELYGSENISLIVAGTDGSDGPTTSAGGVVDGDSAKNTAQAIQSLQQADAGSYLRASGDLFASGPTGTNVMDLLIAIVR